MSPRPSPGPSHPHSFPSQQRQKQKPYTIGIAAGAEDAKYQAKYKDLKQKVKEIEADNDRLHFKVLQAKRSIQRMKLERAILYERLSAVPPSPEMADRHLPPIQSGPAVPAQQIQTRTASGTYHQRNLEPEQALAEHIRTHEYSRVAPGPDGRPVIVPDPPIGPGIPPPAQSPHHAHSEARHLPPIPQIPAVQPYDHPSSRSHSHSYSNPNNLASPQMHERTRSQSSSRSRSHQGYPPYQEALPSVQHVIQSSPALSERERPRRHEVNELAGTHDPHGRHQTPHSQMSPRTHSLDARGSARIHPHQRIGPGSYANREDVSDRQREMERERERDWEREQRARELGRGGRDMSTSSLAHSPHSIPRTRAPMDYPEHHTSSRMREDAAYYHDASGPSGYPLLSRSGTPGSGSGSGSGAGAGEGPSRPDSRAQYYEQDHVRTSYRLRPVNPHPGEEADFVHEDGRAHSRDRGSGGGSGGGHYALQEQSRLSLESRKRTRNEMDVDSENDVGEAPRGSGLYSTGRLQDDRGSKRYHREHNHRRSVDNHEDNRMGPS